MMQSTKRPFDGERPSCNQSKKHPRIDSDRASSHPDQDDINQAVNVDSSQTSVSDKDILLLNGRTNTSQESQNQNNGTIQSSDMKASNLLKNIVTESLQNSGGSTRSSGHRIQVPHHHDYVQLHVPEHMVLKQSNNDDTVMRDGDIPKSQTDKGAESSQRICTVVKVERRAHCSEDHDRNARHHASMPPDQQPNKQFQKVSQHRLNVQRNVVQLGNGVSLTNISIPTRALSAPFTLPVSVTTHLPGSNVVYSRPAEDCNNISNLLTSVKGGTNVTSNNEIGSQNNLKERKTLGLPGTSQGSPLDTTLEETIRSVYYLSANVKNMSATNSQKNKSPSPNIMPGTNISYKSRGTNYRNRNGNIKRPMNAFVLWARNHRRNISQSMPSATVAEISFRLGQAWAKLPPEEKEQYYREAEKIQRQHSINFPGWEYKPNQTKKDVDTQHVRLRQKYDSKRSKTKATQHSKVDSKSSSCQTDLSITYPESSSTSTSSKDSTSEAQASPHSTRHPATDKPATSTVRRGRPPSVTKRVEWPLLKEQCQQKNQQSKGKKDADKQTKERSGNRKTRSKSGNEEKQLYKGSDNTKGRTQVEKAWDRRKGKRQVDKGCDKTKENRQLDKGCQKKKENRQLDKGGNKMKSRTSHLKGSGFHRKQSPTNTSTDKNNFESSDVKSLDKAYKKTTKERSQSSAEEDERGIDREYTGLYRPFYYNSNEDFDRKASTYEVDVSSWQKYLSDTKCKMDNNKTKSNNFTPIIKSEKDDAVQKSQSDPVLCPTTVAVTLRRSYSYSSSVSAPETSTSKIHTKNSSTTAGYVSKSEECRPLKKRTNRFMRDCRIGNAEPDVTSIQTDDEISGSFVATDLTEGWSNVVGDSGTSTV